MGKMTNGGVFWCKLDSTSEMWLRTKQEKEDSSTAGHTRGYVHIASLNGQFRFFADIRFFLRV